MIPRTVDGRPLFTDAGRQFDALFEHGGAEEPHGLYRELRLHDPVFWSNAANAWVLTRYADVRRALGTETDFAVLYGEAGATIHGKSLLQMRGKEHRRKKAVIAREIRNLKKLERLIRPTIEQIVSQLITNLRSSKGAIELRLAYTGAVPLAVVTWLLEISEPDQLRGWYQDLALAGVENLIGNPEIQARGLQALHQFEEIIAPIVAAQVTEPQQGVLGALAQLETDGTRMSENELTTLAGFLLTAGVETTDRTMASLLRRIALYPDERRALQNDPALVVPAIAETLRFEPAVHGVGRMALIDDQFSDIDIRKGERLIGLIGSANRDEDHFPDADRFDVERFVDSTDKQFTPASDVLTFGAGAHHCTGSLLGKLEMKIAITEFLSAFGSMSLLPESPTPTGVMLRAPEKVIVKLSAHGEGLS